MGEQAAGMRSSPTPAQLRLVQCICNGYTVKEAAFVLGISPQTARVHAENLRRRLDVRSMNHVIALGFRQGWLH